MLHTNYTLAEDAACRESSLEHGPNHDAVEAATASDLEKSTLAPKAPDQSHLRQFNPFHWIIICISLYISIFIYGLDTTIAAEVQGPVVEDFGHVEQLAWIGAGFPLGSVSVILLYGALYEAFDMKWVYVVSMVLFEAGSALCGAAPNMDALIVGRVIAGAGGSGVFMGCLNYFTHLTAPERRGLYIAGTGFCWGIGAVLGPVVGGSFVDSNATWRWAFYINLIIGAAFAPAYLFGLPSIRLATEKRFMQRVRNVDGVGFLLNAGLWVFFSMGFTMAGGQWAWSDSRSIGIIISFVAVTILFMVQQTYAIFTSNELRCFPIQLLRSRSQVLLFIGTAANISALFITVYFIPLYFQFVRNDTALQAAVRLLPFVVITVSVNLSAGHLLSKIKYYSPIFIISGILMTIGGALLFKYLTLQSSTASIYGFTIVTAVGSGLTLQIGYAVATLKAPKYMGQALALQNVAQIGGTVICLVIAGQVFHSAATRNLTDVLRGTGFTSVDIQAAISGAKSDIFQQLSGELREQATIAITGAIQQSFILVIVGGAVLTIAGFLMKLEKLFEDI